MQLGLTGTCELQICRSAGPWSLGTPGRIEHSIQNAYLKGSIFCLNQVVFQLNIFAPLPWPFFLFKNSWDIAIEMSEHFVYIENQFFITS
jgi:phospholipase D1/2